MAFVVLAPVTGMATETAVVAKVNGEGIAATVFERQLKTAFVMRGILGSTAKKQGIFDAIRDEVLGQLIDEELLCQDARDKNLVPDDKSVADRVYSTKASFPSPEAYLLYLKKSFLAEDAVFEFTRRKMSLENLIRTEFSGDIAVSEDEIHSYYTSHADEFTAPEKVRARHILIRAKPDAAQETKDAAMKTIQEILRQAESGADFGELARKYSACPSARKGGDLGFFPRGRMAKPFEDAAFALKPGEISGVVTTEYGYHLIKVEDRTAAFAKSEADAAPGIREKVESGKRDQAVRDYATQLRKKAKIEILLKAEP